MTTPGPDSDPLTLAVGPGGHGDDVLQLRVSHDHAIELQGLLKAEGVFKGYVIQESADLPELAAVNLNVAYPRDQSAREGAGSHAGRPRVALVATFKAKAYKRTVAAANASASAAASQRAAGRASPSDNQASSEASGA